MSYDGLARFDVPAGMFSVAHTFEVSQLDSASATSQFDDLSSLFRVGNRADRPIQLLAGTTAPTDGTFEAVVTVPSNLTIPAGQRPELFVQVYEDLGMEVLDNWQLFSSSYDPTTRTLTAPLPAWCFTSKRSTDGRYAARLIVATTPGAASLAPSQSTAKIAVAAAAGAATPDDCKAGFIGKPVEGDFGVTSEYGERIHPIDNVTKMHWGADYGVPTGTQVVAAANGKVERIKDQGSVGYGKYLILRHNDGSATLYAHLDATSASVGQEVKRGDPIATSDNSGGSTGAHLHFEYVPNGEIVQSKNRIDPTPCIQDQTVTGSITVRDNGNLADDAFAIFLDNIELGTTAIGAANNFAINNLIPGAHVLRLMGIVVPDDIGTYEIQLASGITFSDGTTTRSGVVANQASANFDIIVPTTPTRSAARLSSQPQLNPVADIPVAP